MPFPQDNIWYERMAKQSSVISNCIESLSVQVSWTGLKIAGVPAAQVAAFGPLIEAFFEYGDLENALQVVTHELFTFGNLAIFVSNQRVLTWPPSWSMQAEYQQNVLSPGERVIEAKLAPVSNGFGTPALEPALVAFKAYWQAHNQQIAAMAAYAANPVGPVPVSARQVLDAMNRVLSQMGFDPWTPGGNTPNFRKAQVLRTLVKQTFERDILQPFGATAGVTGTPTLVP
jgi:hypothetical protein